MYRFSFRIKHKNCAETGLSIKFPKQHITVLDIQAKDPKKKQYLYYIKGNQREFDKIIEYLQRSKTYKVTKEIERTKETLVLLVVLFQEGYIQNTIQKYNGFFIDLHTVSEGYEYWHVGVVERNKAINKAYQTPIFAEEDATIMAQEAFETSFWKVKESYRVE